MACELIYVSIVYALYLCVILAGLVLHHICCKICIEHAYKWWNINKYAIKYTEINIFIH